jgi:hypothetical protein
LFSYSSNIYYFLEVRDQESHLHKTTRKIIFLCILIVTFLDRRREDRRFWTEW